MVPALQRSERSHALFRRFLSPELEVVRRFYVAFVTFVRGLIVNYLMTELATGQLPYTAPPPQRWRARPRRRAWMPPRQCLASLQPSVA